MVVRPLDFFKIASGTIVDATIIHSPPSTKNKDRRRDPAAHAGFIAWP